MRGIFRNLFRCSHLLIRGLVKGLSHNYTIFIAFSLEIHYYNAYENDTQLRKIVCEFAPRKEHPMVQCLAEMHDGNASISFRSPWVPFFSNMKKWCFAEGPELYCKTFLLEKDIAVLSFGNNENNPYMLISGCGDLKYPPLYLGNLLDLHIQSFISDKSEKKQIAVKKGRLHTFTLIPLKM